MQQLLVRALLASVLAAGAMGCRHSLHYSSHAGHHHHGGVEAAGLVAGVLIGAAIAEAAREPEPEPVYTSNVYYVYGPPPPPLPPSPRDRVRTETDDLRPFDPHAARAALSSVEVSPCREAGAPSGFGHARVTMNPDGRISKVVVDEPSGMSPEAVQCIGDRIGATRVAAFKGGLVTIGTTFHVR